MTAAASQATPRRIRPTDLLKREHREIEVQLEILSAALRQLADTGPETDLLQRIEGIAAAIDEKMSLHHRKEEEGLFPLLRPYLDDGLDLDGRVADHEDLRIMSGKFKGTLQECRCNGGSGSTFAAQMLKGYGLYIIHLVLEHLLKEDQILFLVAEHYLTVEQEAEIFRHFERIDAGPIA